MEKKIAKSTHIHGLRCMSLVSRSVGPSLGHRRASGPGHVRRMGHRLEVVGGGRGHPLVLLPHAEEVERRVGADVLVAFGHDGSAH